MVVKPTKASASHTSTLNITLLTSLQELHRRLELAESGLTSHLHVPHGDSSLHECTVHIQNLQVLIRPQHAPENTHKSCIIMFVTMENPTIESVSFLLIVLLWLNIVTNSLLNNM